MLNCYKLLLDESGYSAMLKNKKDLENENRLRKYKRIIKCNERI